MTPEEQAIRARDAATWPSVLNPDPQPPNPEWDRHYLIGLLDAERTEVGLLRILLDAEVADHLTCHREADTERADRLERGMQPRPASGVTADGTQGMRRGAL